MTDQTWICSDQGVHYTARAYRDKLAELGVRQSMSHRPAAGGNAPIGSLWGRLKEQTGPTAHLTPSQAIQTVDDCIHYHNDKRGQARLGWTPTEYETTLTT